MPGKKRSNRREPGRSSGPNRKTLQLCRQVARTVESVIIGELDDECLRNLVVAGVEPAPDESRLLVTVAPCAPGIHLDPMEVMNRLGAASAHIRAEVATAITRKRTPSLAFQYAEPLEVEDSLVSAVDDVDPEPDIER